MSWLLKIQSFSRRMLVGFVVLGLCACGVKGDPLPPVKPTEIGRGRPTYQKATAEIVEDKQKQNPAPSPKDSTEDGDQGE